MSITSLTEYKALLTYSCLRYKYRRLVNPDGNFTAQHNQMRRPDLDVALTDGDGYCVGVDQYEEHLKAAGEVKEVYLFKSSGYQDRF